MALPNAAVPPLDAQPPRVSAASEPAGALSLRVSDANDMPVALAHVELRRGPRTYRVQADSSGGVQLANLTPGAWSLSVRRLGFAPTDVDIDIATGSNRVTVELRGLHTELAAVRVNAKADLPSGRLREFEMRLSRGAASAVVTRDQIERRNPTELTQILRGIAGLRIADSLGSAVAISTRGLKPVRAQGGIALVPCVMRIAIDGVLMPALTNLNAVPPQQVHGVEVFFGSARIPEQYNGTRTDNFCGMILLWTREG